MFVIKKQSVNPDCACRAAYALTLRANCSFTLFAGIRREQRRASRGFETAKVWKVRRNFWPACLCAGRLVLRWMPSMNRCLLTKLVAISFSFGGSQSHCHPMLGSPGRMYGDLSAIVIAYCGFALCGRRDGKRRLRTLSGKGAQLRLAVPLRAGYTPHFCI